MPTKTINIELQKKWFDFTNPTKIEHYGYSFPESDLRQFPEGRVILCEIKQWKLSTKRFKRNILPIVSLMGKQMRKTMDNLVREVILAN